MEILILYLRFIGKVEAIHLSIKREQQIPALPYMRDSSLRRKSLAFRLRKIFWLVIGSFIVPFQNKNRKKANRITERNLRVFCFGNNSHYAVGACIAYSAFAMLHTMATSPPMITNSDGSQIFLLCVTFKIGLYNNNVILSDIPWALIYSSISLALLTRYYSSLLLF